MNTLAKLYVPPWSGFFDLLCGGIAFILASPFIMLVCGVFHY